VSKVIKRYLVGAIITLIGGYIATRMTFLLFKEGFSISIANAVVWGSAITIIGIMVLFAAREE